MCFAIITKGNIICMIQIIVAIFSLVQLSQGAFVVALISVFLAYIIGSLEYT